MATTQTKEYGLLDASVRLLADIDNLHSQLENQLATENNQNLAASVIKEVAKLLQIDLPPSFDAICADDGSSAVDTLIALAVPQGAAVSDPTEVKAEVKKVCFGVHDRQKNVFETVGKPILQIIAEARSAALKQAQKSVQGLLAIDPSSEPLAALKHELDVLESVQIPVSVYSTAGQGF